MKYVVVIPAKNEEESIGWLVSEIADTVVQLGDDTSVSPTVYVIDDGSTDRTAEVARDAGAHVFPMKTEGRRGLADVYRYGLQLAHRDGAMLVTEFDAGGSHDPIDIAQHVVEIQRGAEVVTSTRFHEAAVFDAPWQRRLFSKAGTLLTNALHGTKFTDATSGFTTYNRQALNYALVSVVESTGHFYQTEMRLLMKKFGMRIAEVPITYRSSSSSLNWKSVFEALRLVMK